jgi:hypothetical protein
MSQPGNEHQSAATHEARPMPAERRVSVLVGDRFCATCGFNLVGQTVVREPHYNMLMVRCPECGTPAAMQEYPLLGRWANRWARVLAVAMILFMTMFTIGASLACWGVSIPPVWAMVEPLAGRLGDSHVNFRRAAALQAALQKSAAATAPAANNATAAIPDPLAASLNTSPSDPAADPSVDPAATSNSAATPVPPIAPVPPPASAISIKDEEWWRRYGETDWAMAVNPREVIASSGGGWASGIAWSGLKWLVVSLPVAFLFGVIYSVLLLGSRRWKAMLIIPIVLGLSTCWVLIDHIDGPSRGGGNLNEMAASVAGTPLHLVVYMFMAYAMAMGIWVGRPIARVFVQIMLPPRLCGSLADLWLCEGKTPPCAAQARRKPR